LEDYRLAYRVGGADDDLFIIQFLLIYLADSVRAWLDHLLRNVIDSLEDLKEIFTGNFKGMYVHPGKPWDLKSCWQKPSKSLWDYIQCFSRKCHELPRVADTDVISMFWSRMTHCTLVHELGRAQPSTTKQLLGITTRHTSSKEVVGAAFILVNVKAVDGGSRVAWPKAPEGGWHRCHLDVPVPNDALYLGAWAWMCSAEHHQAAGGHHHQAHF
jgi:hypothetical protein